MVHGRLFARAAEERPAGGPARFLRRDLRFAEQFLRPEFWRPVHYQDRRKDLERYSLPDSDSQFGSPARPHGLSGPAVVRGISRQQDRDIRYQDGANPGVAGPYRVDQSL